MKTFIEKTKNTATLSSIITLLNWDQETMMPEGAASIRSSQIALLSSLVHEQKTSKDYRNALKKLIDIDSGTILANNLNDIEKKALILFRKDYIENTKLPSSFIQEFAKTTSEVTNIWIKAKQDNDFASFAPHLEKIIALSQKKADILGYENSPYDALVDGYEPDMTAAKLTKIFSPLEKGLQSLVKELQQKASPRDAFLYSNYPHDKQLLFGNQILDKLNIDRKKSRLDESVHPFSVGIHPTDVRYTTKISPNFPMSSILSILHEAGHSLYELGLPSKYYGTPICEAASLGIHESQSRFWETRIGKSYPFWQHFYPLMQDVFPKNLESVSLDTFYKGINAVKTTLIRVDSDEVTYCLHILLRFEIEKALIEGTLSVYDIPKVWNETMQKFLGITPKTDAEGCLQDVHFSCGLIGYFPTYALGNLYASHFFSAFEIAHPNWEQNVAKGEFEFIKKWLLENIHCHGKYYSSEELAKKVTGKPISEKAYLNYLTNKFDRIYLH